MLRIPHLETDITQACQLSCVACNHAVSLWRQRGPWSTTVAQVEHDLGILSRVLHAEKWGALGGEPTLHKDLVPILHAARASGIADKLEVWTNGIGLVGRMRPEFWKAFDVIVLSVYEGKHTDSSLGEIQRKCRDSGIELVVKDERTHPNFRTLLEPTPTDPETTRVKFQECFFRSFSRSASYGFFFTCCCGPHLPLLLQGQSYGTDGIRITEDLTEDDLRAYLNRSDPLGACTICAGRKTAKKIPWTEARHPLTWIAASKGMA